MAGGCLLQRGKVGRSGGFGGCVRAWAGWPTSAANCSKPAGVCRLRNRLQLAWAADNTNTALPGFLETARQIAGQTAPPRRVPGDLAH
jgi:hypothetical protein